MSLRKRRNRDERGAVAILVAVLAIGLLMLAALGVDIGLQINNKHQLHTTLDSAAQSGASKLPGSSAAAKTTALAYAKTHDPTATGTLAPNVDFWCVVASKASGSTFVVDTTQVPTTCYPGIAPYTAGALYRSTGRKISCSAVLCAIPCVEPTPNNGTPKIACNTIRVYQGREVDFSFAPAGGIDNGYTGNLVSVACKGSCGTVAPNPMDVVVVADRTPSMDPTDQAQMITGIKGMLTAMTPSQQYVALGAIGRSVVTGTARTTGSCRNNSTDGLTYPGSSSTSGSWVPVAFHNNYLTTAGVADTNSTLVKGVNCLSNQSTAQGTSLAAPMKAAARYLLGYTTNNISSLPSRTGTPQRVLIFETDGQPNETPTTGGSTSLTTTTEPFSNRTDGTTSTVTSGSRTTITKTFSGGNQACTNLVNVAAAAKNAGILVIVVGYNMTYSTSEDSAALRGWNKRCTDYDGYEGAATDITRQNWETSTTSSGRTTVNKYVKPTTSLVAAVLAQAASPKPDGTPSAAQNTCTTTAERTAENTDGDYFFCAASGDDMAPIFRTALTQASSGIKLIKMP